MSTVGSVSREEPDDVHPRSNPRDDATRSLVFRQMWVMATVLHMIHRADVFAGPTQVVTIVVALFVFAYPRRLECFLAFVLAHMGLYLTHAPNTGNHELFMFIVEGAMLASWAASRRHGSDGWFSTVAPIIRLATLFLYAFAVFHKLNSAYLGPGSCGASMPWWCIARLAAPFGDPDVLFMPESAWPMWLRNVGIYGSLVIEASIPFLLAIPRTWLLGFLAGFALHFFLGVCFFWHFTPMLWAVFFLFAPPVVIERVAGTTASAMSRLREYIADFGLSLTRTRLLTAALLGLLAVAVATHASVELQSELARYSRGAGAWSLARSGFRTWIGWLPFTVYSFVLLWLAVGALWRHPLGASGGTLWHFPNRGLGMVVAGLLLLNGFAPYLGIKDHQSFAMFSGLETHAGLTNHLFMPLIEVVDHSRDIVEPISTSRSIFGRDLARHTARPMRYRDLLHDVKGRVLSGHRNIHVEFRRNGVETISDQFETTENYRAEEPSWLEWKFLPFRNLRADEAPARCRY